MQSGQGASIWGPALLKTTVKYVVFERAKILDENNGIFEKVEKQKQKYKMPGARYPVFGKGPFGGQ